MIRTNDLPKARIEEIAHALCNNLIATHGLCAGVMIARVCHTEAEAVLIDQQRRHPEDKIELSPQPLQPEAEISKKLPPIPKVGG